MEIRDGRVYDDEDKDRNGDAATAADDDKWRICTPSAAPGRPTPSLWPNSTIPTSRDVRDKPASSTLAQFPSRRLLETSPDGEVGIVEFGQHGAAEVAASATTDADRY